MSNVNKMRTSKEVKKSVGKSGGKSVLVEQRPSEKMRMNIRMRTGENKARMKVKVRVSTRCGGKLERERGRGRICKRHAGVEVKESRGLTKMPSSYAALVRQVQNAMRAAFLEADDAQKLLMEVEFPVGGLNSCAGDDEGQAEMTRSAALLKEVLGEIIRNRKANENSSFDAGRDGGEPSTGKRSKKNMNSLPQNVRILFPDKNEMIFQKKANVKGQNSSNQNYSTSFGTEGDMTESNIFEVVDNDIVRAGYLTEPSPWLELGWDKNRNKRSLGEIVANDDEFLVAAYPHFNVQEVIAIQELDESLRTACSPLPIMIFNGELDRYRSGYYPSFFYPRCASLASDWLPDVKAVYYIHNFKGSKFGSLFRCFPEPWQVIRRNDNNDYNNDSSNGINSDAAYRVIHTQDTMPSLAEVADMIRNS